MLRRVLHMKALQRVLCIIINNTNIQRIFFVDGCERVMTLMHASNYINYNIHELRPKCA